MPRAGANARRLPHGPTRRRVLAGLAGAVLLRVGGLARGAEAAQPEVPEIRFFRIATGTTSGTYFPIGGLIANAISNPPGSRPCDRGGSCGVPGLIAVAQATQGSVENVELLRTAGVEAGLVQADVAYWAYTGTATFASRPPFPALRSIGMLYAEAIQLVVRADSDLRTVADLKGRAVSLGEEGSGILIEARTVLDGFGVKEAEVRASYLRPGMAADRLAEGQLDAFFMVGGFPVAAISDVAGRVPIRLIPLGGDEAAGMRARQRFFMPLVIPADTYTGVTEDVPTLGVGAELVVRADLDDELIHGVTKALWHENTRRLLIEGHPRGRSFDPSKAVANVSIPLHPGAERYYREVGLIGNAANEPSAEKAEKAQ